MTDLTTQEQTMLNPQIDEEQVQTEAQVMAQTQDAYQPIQGSETASLGSQVAKQVTKGASDFSAWANRHILSIKPQEAPLKTPQELLTPIKQVEETAEQSAVRLFDSVEKQQAPVFNRFNRKKEALGLVDSDVNEFDSAMPYQINFDTIRDEEEVRGVIAYMAEANKGSIQEMRRGVVSDEQLYKLADDLNADPKMIQDVLARQAGGAIPPAEYIVAIRQTLDQSAVKLKELANTYLESQSPTDKLSFSKQFDFHRKFQASFMGIRAEYGRGLRAMGIPYDAQSRDILETMGAMEANLDVDTLARTISTAKSTKGINQQVDGYSSAWQYGADVFYTNYVSSMLSGLSTQVLNIGGNIANISANLMERKIASWMPKGKNALDEVQNDELTATLIGYRSSFFDAWKSAWHTLKTGEMYKGMDATGNQVDTPLPSEYFKLSGATGSIMDFTFNALRFPIRNVMGGTDAFFKTISERGELASLAYRQAKGELDNGTIQGDYFTTRLQELMTTPTEELKSKSTMFAREMAFQENPGEQMQKILNAVNTTPGLKYFVPFARTMSNMFSQTMVERTPLAPLSKKFREDIQAGGARRQLAESKLGMGLGITTLALGLAENDMITPPLPKDKATRDLWKSSGIKPNSFVFTQEDGSKVYVPHTGLEPFSSFFNVVASLHDYNKKMEFFDFSEGEMERYNDVVGGLLFAVSENTLNKTFAVGLQGIFDAVNNGANSFERLAGMTANSMIPYSGLRRNITKELDEYKRSTDGIMEYIQAQIPMMSDELPPILDIFGEEVKHDYTWLRWTPSYETKDAVRKELESIHEATRRMAGSEFRDTFGQLLVKPKDRVEWQKFARKEFTDSQGRNLHGILSDIIQDEGYKQLTSIEKLDLISSTIRRVDMAALQTLSKENPELYLKLHNKDIVKRAFYNLEKEGMTREDAYNMAKEEFAGGM